MDLISRSTILGLIQTVSTTLSSYLTLVATCEAVIMLQFYSQENQAHRV